MLDEKDFQKLDELISHRISAVMENNVMPKMDELISRRIGIVMENDVMPKMDELISRRIGIVMENDVMPKFDLLADGIAGIQEKLVPRSRVDDLEDDVRFLKSMVHQMAEEISRLKKAQ